MLDPPILCCVAVLCGGGAVAQLGSFEHSLLWCSVRNLLLVFCLVSASAFCQVNDAVLGGTVIDPQGEAFAGADVQLTAASTQAVRHVSSRGQGIFEITGLPPGDYELKVEAPGFSSLTQNLRLEVAQQMVLNLSLQVAAVKNVVGVDEITSALHPTDSSAGEVIEPVAIHDLPLNGRMLIDQMLTVPGRAHLSHGAQTGNVNPLY